METQDIRGCSPSHDYPDRVFLMIDDRDHNDPNIFDHDQQLKIVGLTEHGMGNAILA